VKEELEETASRTIGRTFTISDDLIRYSTGLVLRRSVDDTSVLEEALTSEIGVVTDAYCLYIDNERIGATPYEGALEELLEQIKLASTDEDTIKVTFAEEVEIRKEIVPSEELVNLGYLAELLYSTKTEEVNYEVQAGDTWTQIAADHGMTSEQLLRMNPGYNINRLQAGEVLTISASVPYLTMTVVKQERSLQEIDYEIEYTDTPDLYQGDEQITSAGSYGCADVFAGVTYVNGVEIERTVYSSTTLKEPVTETRLRGTTERPSWFPTGTFRWPINGHVTSYFGYRQSPGGIGSTNHQGIDIAAAYGAPIYAADGGTIKFSGWQGGYGYLVIIDHGNGYETYYGHNSELVVRAGDHVYKGQQIAEAGSTGNSTGNHCHFGIKYNGTFHNPMNYLT